MAQIYPYVDPVMKKIIIKDPPWPDFWLEVCRGHEIKRPWFLRWLWKKRRFHDRPHRRSTGIGLQELYSFLVEEWTAPMDSSAITVRAGFIHDTGCFIEHEGECPTEGREWTSRGAT